MTHGAPPRAPAGATTRALAVVVGVLLLALAWDRLPAPDAAGPGGEGAPDHAGTRGPPRPPAPEGAPVDLDAAGLATRYRPTLDARPFEARSFRPPPPPGTPAPERTRDPEPPPPSGPAPLSLRLTGIVGLAAGRAAVLEEGGTGRGLVVTAGRGLGGAQVADVGTASLVVVDASGARLEVALGDALALPRTAEGLLEVLQRAPPPEPRAPAPGEPGAQISDEQRNEVLERLRERRRRQLGGQ